MATLSDLERSGLIERIDVELDPGEVVWRRIYATQDFTTWMTNVLPTLETKILGGDSEPIEQVDAVFHAYVVGAPLNVHTKFKRLNSTPDHSVWEFKTADIRIFAWVPERDAVICTFGDMKDNIELMRSYNTYIARTRFVREQMPLDEPKAVESRSYNDVLSDAN